MTAVQTNLVGYAWRWRLRSEFISLFLQRFPLSRRFIASAAHPLGPRLSSQACGEEGEVSPLDLLISARS